MNHLRIQVGYIRRSVSLMIFMILCVLQSHSAGVAQNKHGYKLEPAKPYFLIGNPMKVFLSIEYKGKEEAVLGMNSLGLPGGLRMRLVSSQGEVLEPKGREQYLKGIEGISGADMPNSEMYPWRSGEIVKLAYDLNEIFTPQKAGKYKLELHYATVFAQTEVNLVANEAVARSKFRGYTGVLFRLTTSQGIIGPIVEGNVIVNKATVDGKEFWFLNVEGIKLAWREASNLFEPLSIPANTQIIKVALDFKGQLWIVLEADTKQSLAVWNLASGLAQTPIEWQTGKIEIGSTPLYDRGKETRIVIAGIAGQTKISTLSYGVAPQAKQ